MFQEEHEDWLRKEEERRKDEEIRRREEEEINRKWYFFSTIYDLFKNYVICKGSNLRLFDRFSRATENLKRLEMIEKDRQFAILAQAQIDRELQGETSHPTEYSSDKYLPSSPSHEPPPSYSSVADQTPPQSSTAPPYAGLDEFSSGPDRFNPSATSPASAPAFDRSSKPVPSSSIQNDIVFQSDSASLVRPVIPDRSRKPQYAPQDLHGVIVPEKLIRTFLSLAKQNSDKNIETLGMLGGKLAKNR